MGQQAVGTFEVTIRPQPAVVGVGDPAVARMALEKRYSGDLEGSSLGEMLAGNTATPGSAGYVAIERVVGTLGSRRGSFLLQHVGTLDRGRPSLSVAVIPDSGTDGLVGLAGSMRLERIDGTHSYRFDYSLGSTPPPA